MDNIIDNKYFKEGDKFEPSRMAIERTIVDEKGIEKKSFVRIGVDFVGCTVIPGIGIKTPEPNSLVLCSDGSMIDLKTKELIRFTGGAAVRSPLVFEENGLALIDLPGVGDFYISQDGKKFAQYDNEQKIKEIAEKEITEEVIKTLPESGFELFEKLLAGKEESFDIMETNDKTYTTDMMVSENGKKVLVTSNVSIIKDQAALFEISKGDSKISSLVKEGDDYFLDFASNAEIESFLATEEGKQYAPNLIASGEGDNKRYKFKVDNCTTTTAGGFHVEALGGVFKYECNNAASSITLGKQTIMERITPKDSKSKTTPKVKGYNMSMSTNFVDMTRTQKAPFSFGKANAESIKELESDKFIKNMPVDMLIAMLNNGTLESGVKHYKSGDLEIMGTTLDGGPLPDGATKGKYAPSLLCVRYGDKNYILHKGSMVPIRGINYLVDKNKSTERAIEISPFEKSEGQTLILPFKAGKKDDEKLKSCLGFFSHDPDKIPVAQKKEKLFESFDFTNSGLIPTKKTVKSTFIMKEPEKVKEEPEKDKEKPNDPPQPPEPPEDDKDKDKKKHDPKKAGKFWDTISNACFLSMFFCMIASMFGLGFIAMPLALGFAAAGMITKGISYQGGFGLGGREFDNITADGFGGKGDKDKSKKKEKVNEKAISKLRENIDKRDKTIEGLDNDIAKYKNQLGEYEKQGLENSKEAKAIKKKLEKATKKKTKLENKNAKKIAKLSPLQAVAYYGKLPTLEGMDDTTIRKDFGDDPRIQSQIVKGLLNNKTYQDHLGTTLAPSTEEVFDNLTMGERALVFGDLEEIDNAYGGKKDNEWISKFAEYSMLLEEKNPTKQQQARIEKLEKEFDTAEKTLGKTAYNEWREHISETGKERLNKFKDEYGVTGVSLLTLREQQEKIYHLKRDKDYGWISSLAELNRLKEKETLTEQEETRLKMLTERFQRTEATMGTKAYNEFITRIGASAAELADARASVDAAKTRVGEYAFSIEKERVLSIAENDPNMSPELLEELKARYNDPAYIKEVTDRCIKERYPQLIADLNPAKVADPYRNPISNKVQAMDIYITKADHKDFVESEIETQIYREITEDRAKIEELTAKDELTAEEEKELQEAKIRKYKNETTLSVERKSYGRKDSNISAVDRSANASIKKAKTDIAIEHEREIAENKRKKTTELSEKYGLDLEKIENDMKLIIELSAKEKLTPEEQKTLDEATKRKTTLLKNLGTKQYDELLEVAIAEIGVANPSWGKKKVKEAAIKQIRKNNEGKKAEDLKISFGQEKLDEIAKEAGGVLTLSDKPVVTAVYGEDETPVTEEEQTYDVPPAEQKQPWWKKMFGKNKGGKDNSDRNK